MYEEQLLEIVIPPNQEKQRLDKYLVKQLSAVSRARLQRLISEGNVHVDGMPVKPSHQIAPQETIHICIPKPQKVDILPENIPLDIVFEDEHLLVVNKDAGMVVHPAFSNYTGTLVNALLHHCGELAAIGGRQRPGIVHRLDKDTSGLLVVAKNDQTHSSLSDQFRNKTTRRVYRAITWGRFKKRKDRIETFIARSPKDRKRMSVQQTGKIAATNYHVLETFELHSLLNLQLETGRTHQIRVHLSYLGHPILGDGEYGGRNRRLGALSNKEREFCAPLLEMMPRQALHAKSLGFIHPISNELMEFNSDLPHDMQLLLDRLRN